MPSEKRVAGQTGSTASAHHERFPILWRLTYMYAWYLFFYILPPAMAAYCLCDAGRCLRFEMSHVTPVLKSLFYPGLTDAHGAHVYSGMPAF